MSIPSLRPVLVTGLGVLILSCMDAAMKSVSAAYPLAEVVGLRYAAGTAVSILVFLVWRERRPSPAALKRNLVRSLVVLITASFFFTAIARLPLVEAVSLTFLAPLFTALLGRVLLGEVVVPRIIVGIVFGLIGVGIIGTGQGFDTSHAVDTIGIASALCCAFFYALQNVLLRRQGGSDSSITIVLLSNAFVCLMVSPVMLVDWQTPTLPHALVFGLTGLLGTAGHLCMAWSYARAPAGTLGILEYTAFAWTSVLGFVFYAEVPTAVTTFGAAIIIAACLASTWHRPQSTEQALAPLT